MRVPVIMTLLAPTTNGVVEYETDLSFADDISYNTLANHAKNVLIDFFNEYDINYFSREHNSYSYINADNFLNAYYIDYQDDDNNNTQNNTQDNGYYQDDDNNNDNNQDNDFIYNKNYDRETRFPFSLTYYDEKTGDLSYLNEDFFRIILNEWYTDIEDIYFPPD